MILKTIDLTNFTCYPKLHVDFANSINVIIGRNGAGKTSLLRGIVYAMNFPFTNDGTMGEDLLSAGNPDLKMYSPNYGEFYRSGNNTSATNCSIKGSLLLNGQELSWEMYKRAVVNGSLFPTRYREAYHSFMSIFRETNHLPILSYYSDQYPHRDIKFSSFAKNEIAKSKGVLRNMGYYKWNSDLSCIEMWESRYINTVLRLFSNEDDDAARENEFVNQIMKCFSTPINNGCDDSFAITGMGVYYPVGGGEPVMRFSFNRGVDKTFDELPSGYQRIYAIVFDLAYRAWFLNAGSTDEITGLVIIDEVDLHLHPSLAVEIMDRLHRTFPGVQFIVSSHSPMVISNIESNKEDVSILRLSYNSEEAEKLGNLYGLDYDSMIQDIMGVRFVSNERIRVLKDVILRALRRGKRELAEPKINELKVLVSETQFNEIMGEINQQLSL